MCINDIYLEVGVSNDFNIIITKYYIVSETELGMGGRRRLIPGYKFFGGVKYLKAYYYYYLYNIPKYYNRIALFRYFIFTLDILCITKL